MENRRYTHNNSFVINVFKKYGYKTQAPEKNFPSYYRLASGRIKPPMDTSWASSCSPVHREYKNLCFISIHKKIPKLQTLVYVAMTKEFTDDRFSVNLPSLSNKEVCLGENYTLVDAQIDGEYNEPRFNSVRRCISKL